MTLMELQNVLGDRISVILNDSLTPEERQIDNDVTNNSSDNIRAIPRSINARMTANRFWSADPVITETGILCCELEEALIKEK